MKRLFAVMFTAVLILSMTAFPALAAEVYVLEGTETGMVSLDYVVPEGIYDFQLYFEGSFIASGSFSVSYSFDADLDEYVSICEPSFSYLDPDAVAPTLVILSNGENMSVASFYFNGSPFPFSEEILLYFTPVLDVLPETSIKDFSVGDGVASVIASAGKVVTALFSPDGAFVGLLPVVGLAIGMGVVGWVIRLKRRIAHF